MPRRPATPEQRNAVRGRIRKAAAEVYAEDGVMGISVRAIAQRAGVSTGTIYSYFENLSELMQSLWQEPVARVNEQLEEVAKAHTDPIRRIRALLEEYARFARENPDVYRGALMFVRPGQLPIPDKQPLREFVFHDLLSAAIREGQTSGQVRRGNVSQLAQVLWAGLHGAIAIPINMDRVEFAPPDTLIRATIQALLRSLEPS